MGCGEVLSLRLLTDRETKRSRGIAFISFTTQAGVDAALKYNGEDYAGRSLVVQVAKKGGRGNDSTPGEKPKGCTSVIVKGLAFSATEDDLMKLFKSCGDGPKNILILTDRNTGKSRGMAFVDFDDEGAIDEAMRLSGSELRGRRFHM